MSDTSAKIKVVDRRLSRKWRLFTGITYALVPVALALGLFSGYNAVKFICLGASDYRSLGLWLLMLVMCVLDILEALTFHSLNQHYWQREREFNTVSIISRTLASAADSEKQAAVIEKKQEIVNEVTKKVSGETKASIQEAVDKGFEGMKTFFADMLRNSGMTSTYEEYEDDVDESQSGLLDATLKAREAGKDSSSKQTVENGKSDEKKDERSDANEETDSSADQDGPDEDGSDGDEDSENHSDDEDTQGFFADGDEEDDYEDGNPIMDDDSHW